MKTSAVQVRTAVPDDVTSILELLDEYAQKGLLLKRTKEDLLERLTNFRVCESEGKIIGCLAVRNFGGDLYEIRSLAVSAACANQGIGSILVSGVLEQFRSAGKVSRIFALTYRVGFFERLGFHVVNKEMFPEKIWSDCAFCSKKEHCDETAVLLEIPEK